MDNTSGVDTNSGITAAAPLKTLTKAYEKLRAAGGGTLVMTCLSGCEDESGRCFLDGWLTRTYDPEAV